eukprot:2711661-Pyramimonas_sp.AAC.1
MWLCGRDGFTGEADNGRTDVGSLAQPVEPSLPALPRWLGDRGLCDNSGGRPTAVDFGNACSLRANKLYEEAVPASETARTQRDAGETRCYSRSVTSTS